METTDNTPETLRDNSLRTAGWSYLVGDAALIAAGLLKGDWHEAATGAWWGLGGAAAARYGNPNADKQLELLGRKLGDHLRDIGVTIPDNPTTHALAKPGGFIDKVESFLYTYPSQMLNAVYMLGSADLIRSGFKHDNPWNKASGALVISGALAGLLVPEKKPDPTHPPEGMIGKAVAWLQEKPLRLSGAFYMANNFTTAMSGVNDWNRNNKKSALLKFLTSATYIFANYMLSQSSKEQEDNKKENHEALERIGVMAARVIAAQPKELQEALVEDISRFLSKQPQSAPQATEIASMLHDKLSQLSNAKPMSGSWMQRTGRIASPTSPSL